MIVAFVSKKGGVGKTTSAVNVAAVLARLGHRTLLVDLDSQASASLSLGVARADLAPSAYDLLFAKRPAAEIVRRTATPNLDLVTASVDLVAADLDLAPLRDRELVLGRQLAPLRAAYEWILLDCPPALSVVPLSALAAADGCVVPVVPQPLAWEGVDLLLAAVSRLRERFGAGPRLLGLLLTMADSRTRLARETTRLLRERFGDRLFTAAVPVCTRLAEAPAWGRPLVEAEPESRAALAYAAAARELIDRSASGETGPASKIGVLGTDPARHG
ncbi:MAG TPA: ParA family protein [Thermoanaerobaculia bacterium]|nr:ParA family protein [Thermoanaerobaculia bacterium]